MPVFFIVASAALIVAVSFSALRKAGTRALRATEFWIPVALTVWPAWMQMFRIGSGTEASDSAWFAASIAPALAISGLHIVLRAVGLSKRRTIIGVGSAAIVVLVGIATIAAALTGQSWQHGVLALTLVVAASLSGIHRWDAVVHGVLVSVLLMLVSTAVYALAAPGAFRTDCGDNISKCELLGGFVSIGVGSGSNAFGITLAMLVGVVVYRLRATRGAIAGIAVVVTVLSTGARLATACAAAVALIAWLASIAPWARRLLPYGAGAFGMLSIVTAVVPFPDDAFTERATLWGRARAMIAESPVFGHGISHWVRDAATQPPPPRSYAPHNLWLDPLVAVGFAGVAVLVAGIALGVWFARRRTRGVAWVLVAGVLCAGVFESTVMPFRFGPIPAGFLVLLLLLTASQRRLGRGLDASG
ncbi:O-antigen ligase family protein [Microbacterium sp. No. 7]|uniref:O-antigen ligase family protein n=1 Tax=Microbacterium sp. No. 7 TaxID=1714373 RepID=UPI0006D15025|nr:O-antigen ligase family protein [Microbacterium sp. No. 7]ALJ19045.1 hypothetical protein AOA12_03640 [Microbacterium sp. No. 7]